MGRVYGVAGRILIVSIRWYRRHISPLLPPSCIYTPSCSEYAEEAVRRFGAARGTWLAIRRILRCNPFMQGGYDPVPKRPGPETEDSSLVSGDSGERSEAAGDDRSPTERGSNVNDDDLGE
ncbi:MAG: hypothetical protein AVO35_01535 [Candidatus Aegiribacteria sp. MLS_C]|nr:MAG: hypothetical protein AVO35_01535 [Candidatus Aegiribacteria sp. MLS_C]